MNLAIDALHVVISYQGNFSMKGKLNPRIRVEVEKAKSMSLGTATALTTHEIHFSFLIIITILFQRILLIRSMLKRATKTTKIVSRNSKHDLPTAA